jgi:hypothetical protein
MGYLNLRIVRLLTVLVAVGSVLAQRADDPAFLPETLHCESIGLPGAGTTSYDVKGDSIVRRVTRPNYSKRCIEVEEEKSRRPSPEEWSLFWATLSQLRIQYWKEDYSYQQIRPGWTICDGHQWVFTCRQPGFEIRSRGATRIPSYQIRRKPHSITLCSLA